MHRAPFFVLPIIGLRASSVADVNKVGSDLITTRRVIFVPNVDIKDELAFSLRLKSLQLRRDGHPAL